VIWFCCWVLALSTSGEGAAEATDRMKPPTWTGNYWGPATTRARATGQLPPLPTNAATDGWRTWGRSVLRDGDIVFRLGDARALRGSLPLSRFIAQATASPFSHTGIVAVEDHSPVVYDCSSEGVQRQPFEVWMLDCIGPFGVKRLKPEHRGRIPGVIAYCRTKFEQQVPFDYGFHPDDAALYCVELTEKAFRGQGLALSEPVRIGDWEDLNRYPLTALVTPYLTELVLERPISLEQPVFLPGNDRQGVWASSLLETVFSPQPERFPTHSRAPGLSLQGDRELAAFAVGALRRSYAEFRASRDLRERRAGLGADRRPATSPTAVDPVLARRGR
jgi:Permuted papain-like amidase enzyme, YaeF/YiiX, C92 family